MKTFIFLLLLAIPALAFTDPPRDGTFWQHLSPSGQALWATGWMDGLCTGELMLDPDAYRARLSKLDGLNSNEVREGMTQFYAADYRNLRIAMQDTALLVARYSRAGMSSRECAAAIQALREKYAAINDWH